jgi:arylsulfatase A-like enzyme
MLNDLTGAYPKFITQGYNENYLPIWLQDAGINTYYVGKFLNGHNTNTYRSPPAAGWTSSKYVYGNYYIVFFFQLTNVQLSARAGHVRLPQYHVDV